MAASKGLQARPGDGAGGDRRGGHGVRPARPRRRRLPDRHQVAHRPAGDQADQKYIVCNADEGDSGTFADRMIMEGDPFLPDRGHDHRRPRRRRHQGLRLHPLRIPARLPHDERGDRDRASAPRLSRPQRRWQRPALRPGGRGSAPAPISAARRPRCWRAWRASAASSAPSRRCRRSKGLFGKPTVINNVLSLATCRSSSTRAPPFYADYGMGRSRGTHAAPACRQRQARRPGREGLRPDPARADRGFRRRHRQRPAAARRAGRRPARRLFPGQRCSTRRWTTRRWRRRRACSAMAASSCSTTRVDMAQPGALRHGVLRHRELRQVHALPHRLDPRRRGDRQDHRRPRTGGRELAEPELLDDLCETMLDASLCALGGLTPYPGAQRHDAISPMISTRRAAPRLRAGRVRRATRWLSCTEQRFRHPGADLAPAW